MMIVEIICQILDKNVIAGHLDKSKCYGDSERITYFIHSFIEHQSGGYLEHSLL